MEEIWKDVIDYEGKYQVSNLLNVRSLDRYDSRGCFRKGIILKRQTDKQGYFFVYLYKNGTPYYNEVHRLVSLAFGVEIPEEFKNIPIEKLEIDHIDGNPRNNALDNFRWTDHKGNMNNPHTRKKISERLKGIKRTEETKRKISEANKGRKLSEEAKEKTRQAHLGIKRTEETKRKISETLINGKQSKAVLQIDPNTNEIINEWPSMAEVERQLGYKPASICNCCKEKPQHKTAYGFIWKYKKED